MRRGYYDSEELNTLFFFLCVRDIYIAYTQDYTHEYRKSDACV